MKREFEWIMEPANDVKYRKIGGKINLLEYISINNNVFHVYV